MTDNQNNELSIGDMVAVRSYDYYTRQSEHVYAYVTGFRDTEHVIVKFKKGLDGGDCIYLRTVIEKVPVERAVMILLEDGFYDRVNKAD